MTRDEQIATAKAAADALRSLWPDKADEIERAIRDLADGKRDSLKVSTKITYKLEKFDGEYSPDKIPVEVIEGTG